jgi:hypothetical protein
VQATDRQRFLALMTGISDYYGKVFSNAVLGLYWQGLQRFDFADVERALWAHTQNPDAGQFLPKIADVTRTLQGRTQDQAAVAWGKVDRAVRTVGTYVDVIFDDALIHRVVTELGGWIWLGEQSDDEWPFVAKRFENLYCAYLSRADSPTYPPHLIGLANAHNAREGHEAMPPLLIGEPAKALRIQQGGSVAPLLEVHQAGRFLDMKNMALKITDPNQQPINKPDTKEAA